jgi:hypothetical protein
MRIWMRAYDERAASKSGRTHVIFDQDLAQSRVRKTGRSKLTVQSVKNFLHLNGNYYVVVELSKNDVIQLVIDAFGKPSLVEASRKKPRRRKSAN